MSRNSEMVTVAGESRTKACLQLFDEYPNNKNPTVIEMQQYVDCVNYVHPVQSSDNDVVMSLVFIVYIGILYFIVSKK